MPIFEASYAPRKTAFYTRRRRFAIKSWLHIGYILKPGCKRPGGALTAFFRAEAFLKNSARLHLQRQSYKSFPVPTIFAIFGLPTCKPNTLSYENLD